jgi:hypothetical protein
MKFVVLQASSQDFTYQLELYEMLSLALKRMFKTLSHKFDHS